MLAAFKSAMPIAVQIAKSKDRTTLKERQHLEVTPRSWPSWEELAEDDDNPDILMWDCWPH